MESAEPPPGQRPGWPDWYGPPDDVLPAVVPVELFVYRDQRAVVALHRIDVYGNGCLLYVRIAARATDDATRLWQGIRGLDLGEAAVSLRVEYRDGTTAVADDEPPRPPVLHRLAGQSTSATSHVDAEWTLWLWPLPPAEPFAFVVALPMLGATDERVLVDGSAIRQAAARARPLWPDD